MRRLILVLLVLSACHQRVSDPVLRNVVPRHVGPTVSEQTPVCVFVRMPWAMTLIRCHYRRVR